jgi:hypothetical protein
MSSRSAVFAAVAVSLAALVGAGCSRSSDSPKPEAAAVRAVGDIWVDVLVQRDVIHLVFMKELEVVSHEDCAEVGAAARRMDDLFTELTNALGGMTSADAGRARSLGEVLTRTTGVIAKVRETALAEAPGAWPALRFPLDASLREVESYLNPDDLRGESVMRRPGFETKPLPEPLSPI